MDGRFIQNKRGILPFVEQFRDFTSLYCDIKLICIHVGPLVYSTLSMKPKCSITPHMTSHVNISGWENAKKLLL
jgi:hypothetical protein